MWPFSKLKKVKCPDGRILSVYQNLDHAIPVALKDTGRTIQTEASFAEIGKLKLGGSLSNSVSRLLISIDRQTSSQLLDFRMIYAAYQADPCGNSGLLSRETVKIIESRNRMNQLELQTIALIELIKNGKIQEEEAIQRISNIGIEIGNPDPDLANAAIAHARKDATDMGAGPSQ